MEPGTNAAEPAPWAMQLVARVEKLTPPTTAEVCAAAALAVVALTSDERALPAGEWAAAIDAWQGGGRIRKLVRRARGAAWKRAQESDGVTATVGAAEVRAYVPCQMDRVPDAIRKLQIQSTALDAPRQSTNMPAKAADGPPTMTIVVTPQVEMSWGKTAAQCAHAGQVLWRESTPAQRDAWIAAGYPIAIEHAAQTWWPAAVERADITIRDGGFTEIPAGTMSTAAWWQ